MRLVTNTWRTWPRRNVWCRASGDPAWAIAPVSLYAGCGLKQRGGGATILSEIEEGPPGRRYRAEDLEGHRWFFFEKDEGGRESWLDLSLSSRCELPSN